jgi:NTP pyrophosphatase (non-canonical NTP hydrolase)
MTIRQLLEDSNATAREKGWWDDQNEHSFLIKTLLMITEISEAVEEYRNGHDVQEIYVKDGKWEGVAVEFADLFIRTADLCKQLDIPLEEAIRKKAEFNRTRSHRHGNKKA